jgi:hypothetical protein
VSEPNDFLSGLQAQLGPVGGKGVVQGLLEHSFLFEEPIEDLTTISDVPSRPSLLRFSLFIRQMFCATIQPG